MKRFSLIFTALILTTICLRASISYLDEPNLLGTWGVYEASSSNLPVKFVFAENHAIIYEPDYYGEITPKEYLSFIIGGSISGRFTLHFVGSAAYGLNGFEYGWRHFIIKSFNTYADEFILTDYKETFTLKLKKDYDPIPEDNPAEDNPTEDNPTEENPTEIEYVDLGLSVLWATCNLGASSPYESGDYYAWGETTPNKLVYDETSYMVDWFSLPYDIAGTNNDPAHVELGNGWHLPTYNNILELINDCNWEYSENDHGYYITGPNGNKIFLLLAGGKEGDHYVGYLPDLYWSQGFYMSSSKAGYTDTEFNNNYLYLDTKKYGFYQYKATRGQTVRPVKNNTNKVPIISKDQEGSVNVYNLSGQLEFINVPVKDLQEVLPKGIHIINGYKLLIE